MKFGRENQWSSGSCSAKQSGQKAENTVVDNGENDDKYAFMIGKDSGAVDVVGSVIILNTVVIDLSASCNIVDKTHAGKCKETGHPK